MRNLAKKWAQVSTEQLSQCNPLRAVFLLNIYLVLILACMSTLVSAAEEEKVPTYKLGSGDRLEITTWKEPDLSRENVLIRIDGKITFPLLGDIQASGLTTMQLKYDIEAGLKGYVEHPVVTVTIIESASQKFYMLGEIARPGEYQLVKGLTVVQALSLAGGFTEFANKGDITLFRYEEGKKRTIKISYKEIMSGKDFSQNIFLKANDTIIVP